MIKYEADQSYYTVMAFLGRGQMSTVSLTKHNPTGNHIALRRTNLDELPPNCDISYIEHEVLMISQLHHENLLPYLCSFVSCNELWSIMPLMAYGSARDILTTHYPQGMPEMAIAYILREVLSGLEYIHKKGFIHRSVKASHILISSRNKVVLSGLKYSCSVIQNCRWNPKVHSFPANCLSNLNWLSPELLEQNLLGYNFKSDIYSMAITACELANGIEPFAHLTPTEMILEKLQGFSPQPLDARCFQDMAQGGTKQKKSFSFCRKLIAFKKKSKDLSKIKQEGDIGSSQMQGDAFYQQRLFSEHFHYFAELCLLRDPSLRPSASQLQCHAFIKQCKKYPKSLLECLNLAYPLKVLSPLEYKDIEAVTNNVKEMSLDCSWIF